MVLRGGMFIFIAQVSIAFKGSQMIFAYITLFEPPTKYVRELK